MMSYREYMDNEVDPWIKDHTLNEVIESTQGIHLNTYRAVNPEAHANIVMIHGFCEFFGKYHEMMYRFFQKGYSVFFAELRGYGLSDRTVEFEDQRVYVDSFDEYVEDVSVFVEKIVKPHAQGKPLFLFAHSMGGCVGTLFLERFPEVFSCAVLSSPMLKVDFGKVPDPALKILPIYMKISGSEGVYAPGQGEFTGEQAFLQSSIQDYDRYISYFDLRRKDEHYQTWGATWSWASAAASASDEAVRKIGQITVNVLICQAGLDHMVKAEGQNEAAAHNDKITIDFFPESKHEIWNSTDEIREKWYKDVLAFYKAWTFAK